jgi:hypothetical protein
LELFNYKAVLFVSEMHRKTEMPRSTVKLDRSG